MDTQEVIQEYATKLKPCAHCGNDDCTIYVQETSGAGGAPRFRAVCPTCGTLSDFFDLFSHGADVRKVLEKVTVAWNRRSRVARSEELAEHVGKMRSLLKTVAAGCKAKSPAAQAAREALKVLQEDVDLILHLAKKQEVKSIDVNRAAR